MLQHATLLEQGKQQLQQHPLFLNIHSRTQLQLFMEQHVFAVWDFMTLAKRLQHDLAGTHLPWLPSLDPQAARFINEIVLAEESDQHPGGGHCSHFELYLQAMQEVGANTAPINRFIALQRTGTEVQAALAQVDVAPGVTRFVGDTLHLALNAPTHCVAAAFLHGRESVIPAMFQRFLDTCEIARHQAPTLCSYLARHIEVDAHEHGPAAEHLLQRLTADPAQAQEALHAGLGAVQSRLALWDALHRHLLEART
ncbi:MAG: hypothetical protein GAK37_02810 [Pseudomonas sp.]|nr:MAG: hypothetical protein GAK37_02810 [Pseudomonas sp.]